MGTSNRRTTLAVIARILLAGVLAVPITMVASAPAGPPPPCVGDVNGDGAVNVLDLVELLLCFGQPAVPGCEPADITQDGAVNVLDLIELLLHFGDLCFACDLEGAPGATCHAENIFSASNTNPSFFRTADDFTPLADTTVTSGCLWLITLDGGTTHDLTVTYYDNDPATNLPDESGGMGVGIAGPFSQSGGTLTVTGPTFIAPFPPRQELKFEHAGVALTGGQCYWVEIADTTPTSKAFWRWGSGGNSYFVQDGVGGLNGYDPADVHFGNDLWFCLDIAFDESACSQPPPPPANDDCVVSVPPILDGLTPFSTLSSSTDGFPTNGTGDCAAFGDPQIHKDVWFNYTATATGTLTVSTCNDGNPATGDADYDTKIGIYDGCATVNCPLGGNEIGCNDDGPGCAGFTSIATTPVSAGNCYKIRVGGFGVGISGTGNLAISVGP